jgi:AcrR family transcriptional regulator
VASSESSARPGRPAQIDRDQIAHAALELIDRIGIDGCTMRAVAGELSVTSMALYRHFANKDELLGQIPDALLTDVCATVLTHTKPMAALEAIACGLADVLVAHPNVAMLFLQPVPGPNMNEAAAHVMGLFAERNVEPTRSFELIRVTVALVVGQVFTSHGGDHRPGIELLLRGIEGSLRRPTQAPAS